MSRRILSSIAAAAALFAAAPAFAAETAPSKQPCSCCSDGSIHGLDHRVREEHKQSAAEQKAQPRNDEDPAVRNGFFGG
jgi:hypothetical protein